MKKMMQVRVEQLGKNIIILLLICLFLSCEDSKTNQNRDELTQKDDRLNSGDSIENIQYEDSIEDVVDYKLFKDDLYMRLSSIGDYKGLQEENILADSLFGECIHFWLVNNTNESNGNDMSYYSLVELENKESFKESFFSKRKIKSLALGLQAYKLNEGVSEKEIHIGLGDPNSEFDSGCNYIFQYIPDLGYKLVGITGF